LTRWGREQSIFKSRFVILLDWLTCRVKGTVSRDFSYPFICFFWAQYVDILKKVIFIWSNIRVRNQLPVVSSPGYRFGFLELDLPVLQTSNH
jgi:hypothetical protein